MKTVNLIFLKCDMKIFWSPNENVIFRVEDSETIYKLIIIDKFCQIVMINFNKIISSFVSEMYKQFYSVCIYVVISLDVKLIIVKIM